MDRLLNTSIAKVSEPKVMMPDRNRLGPNKVLEIINASPRGGIKSIMM